MEVQLNVFGTGVKKRILGVVNGTKIVAPQGGRSEKDTNLPHEGLDLDKFHGERSEAPIFQHSTAPGDHTWLSSPTWQFK